MPAQSATVSNPTTDNDFKVPESLNQETEANKEFITSDGFSENHKFDYEDVIEAEFYGTGINTSINILDFYKWSIDTVKSYSEVPYCFAVEYKQTGNTSITNLINALNAGFTALDKGGDALNKLVNELKNFAEVAAAAAAGELPAEMVKGGKELIEAGKQTTEDATAAAAEAATAAINTETGKKVAAVGSALNAVFNKALSFLSDKASDLTVNNGIETDSFLTPYSLLYNLSPTNKKFVFPMLSEIPHIKVTNAFGDSNSDTSILSANSFITGISDIARDVPSLVRDLTSLSGGANSSKPFSGAFVEKAKFFQYPQDTEEYTIQFPLINTTKSQNGDIPEWQKNYRFIMLFAIRNLLYRKNNADFYPPLYYDVVIPGVIREPFCYVSSFDVQPMGMVRNLKHYFNLYQKLKQGEKQDIWGSEIIVPVPEMWIVTIKFKSLIPKSSNLLLSGLYDLNILTGVKT